MKPNYKEQAEQLRRSLGYAEERISCYLRAEENYRRCISENAKEIEELKKKYSGALDKIIELQEKIRSIVEGKNEKG